MRAAFDVVQVVRRVDEHAAHRRADDARVDVGRVGRRQLGRPLGGDRAAGVADQPDLLRARQARGGRAERRAQRVERVASRTPGRRRSPRSRPRCRGRRRSRPASSAGAISADSAVGIRPPERQPAGDRVRRLVFGVERVVEGLVGDAPCGGPKRSGGCSTEVTLTVGCPSSPVDRYSSWTAVTGVGDARDVVGQRARLQHRAGRDVRQAEWRLRSCRTDPARAGPLPALRARPASPTARTSKNVARQTPRFRRDLTKWHIDSSLRRLAAAAAASHEPRSGSTGHAVLQILETQYYRFNRGVWSVARRRAHRDASATAATRGRRLPRGAATLRRLRASRRAGTR